MRRPRFKGAGVHLVDHLVHIVGTVGGIGVIRVIRNANGFGKGVAVARRHSRDKRAKDDTLLVDGRPMLFRLLNLPKDDRQHDDRAKDKVRRSLPKHRRLKGGLMEGPCRNLNLNLNLHFR